MVLVLGDDLQDLGDYFIRGVFQRKETVMNGRMRLCHFDDKNHKDFTVNDLVEHMPRYKTWCCLVSRQTSVSYLGLKSRGFHSFAYVKTLIAGDNYSPAIYIVPVESQHNKHTKSWALFFYSTLSPMVTSINRHGFLYFYGQQEMGRVC